MSAASDNPGTETRPSADFLDLFYDGLFHPIGMYRCLAEEAAPGNRILFYALMIILLVSAIAPVLSFNLAGGELGRLVSAIPIRTFLGAVLWVMMAGIISLVAYAFTGVSRFRTFLTLSAFSTLPWIIVGPLSLFKTGFGDVGVFIWVLAGFVVWLWSVFLFALAIGVTYRLTIERVLIVLLMPFALGMVSLSWIFGFAINIQQLMPK